MHMGRHPCNDKPSVVSDIGLRLSEGIQELKLEQQLAPAREAVSRTFAAGSTNLFNAVAGVRGWMQRQPSSSSTSNPSDSSPNLSRITSRGSDVQSRKGSVELQRNGSPKDSDVPPTPTTKRGLRPLSIVGAQQLAQPEPPKPPPSTFGSWGSNIGSFFSQRAPRLSVSSSRPPSVASLSRGPSPVPPVPPVPNNKDMPPVPKDMPPVPKDVPPVPVAETEELKPRNLDEIYAPATTTKDKDAERVKDEDAMSTHSSMTGMAM